MNSNNKKDFGKFNKNEISNLNSFKGGGHETPAGSRTFKDGRCITYTSDYDHGGGNINYTGVRECNMQ